MSESDVRNLEEELPHFGYETLEKHGVLGDCCQKPLGISLNDTTEDIGHARQVGDF